MPIPLQFSIGQRFGKLAVVRIANPEEIKRTKSDEKHRSRWWIVKCECGREKSIRANSLKSGMTTSCGKFPCRPTRMKLFGEAAKWSAYKAQIASLKIRNKKRRAGPLVWGLSLEQFLEITSSPCHYCGIAWSRIFPNYKKSINGRYKHNGIDRVNSSVGYIPSNCVPCCTNCNLAKAQMSVEEFRVWISRVYHHMGIGVS